MSSPVKSILDVKGNDDTDQPDVPDDGQGCGTWSRHQVQSLLAETDEGRRWCIPYSAFLPTDTGLVKGDEAAFGFAFGEEVFELLLGGDGDDPKFLAVIHRIASGKREIVRPRKDGAVTSVEVRPAAKQPGQP